MPGNRLRPALPRAATLPTACSRRRSASTPTSGTDYHARFVAYLHRVQDEDLTVGVAMTDGKGDRSQAAAARRPNRDAYVHIAERRADGIVIRGAKAIVTGAPYMHELLVMPCRTMTEARTRLRRLLRGADRRARA